MNIYWETNVLLKIYHNIGSKLILSKIFTNAKYVQQSTQKAHYTFKYHFSLYCYLGWSCDLILFGKEENWENDFSK